MKPEFLNIRRPKKNFNKSKTADVAALQSVQREEWSSYSAADGGVGGGEPLLHN